MDLGASAEIWEKNPNEITCLTAHAKKGSRIDFALASPDFFGTIEKLEINHNNGLPAHATLRVGFRPPLGQRTRRCIQQPASIKETLEEKIKDLHPDLFDDGDNSEQETGHGVPDRVSKEEGDPGHRGEVLMP